LWEKSRIEAQGEVKRLALVTLRLFRYGRPPTGEAFWKEIGRKDPMLDPWGKAYVLETPQAGLFLWRSAGPDEGYGTEDDLVAKIPYGEGVTLDLSNPLIGPQSDPVIDAR
jgi:hypothetical protein